MLEQLSPEQEAKLDQYAETWIKYGTQTEVPMTPERKAKIETLVGQMYQAGGLQPPAQIIFTRSPEESLKLYAEMTGDTSSQRGNFTYGQHDANWLSYYEFFHKECADSVGGLEDIVPLIELAKEVGWMLPYENACFVAARPVELYLNAAGSMHRDGGPAFLYADGFCGYYLNGIEVPEWLATTPADKLDAKQIMALTNVDQRREGLRKLGNERMISQLNPTVLDEETVIVYDQKFWEKAASMYGIAPLVAPKTSSTYRLLKLDFGEGFTGTYLEMSNPSVPGCIHVEGVPDDVTTVKGALAFRYGDIGAGESGLHAQQGDVLLKVIDGGKGKEYQPPKYLS